MMCPKGVCVWRVEVGGGGGEGERKRERKTKDTKTGPRLQLRLFVVEAL